MKTLSFEQMEKVQGGKLTQQEVNDFLGSASCVSVLALGPLALFAALSCANWIASL